MNLNGLGLIKDQEVSESYHITEQSKFTIIHLLGLKLNDVTYWQRHEIKENETIKSDYFILCFPKMEITQD